MTNKGQLLYLLNCLFLRQLAGVYHRKTLIIITQNVSVKIWTALILKSCVLTKMIGIVAAPSTSTSFERCPPPFMPEISGLMIAASLGCMRGSRGRAESQLVLDPINTFPFYQARMHS